MIALLLTYALATRAGVATATTINGITLATASNNLTSKESGLR